jgi:glutaredoxin
MVLKVFTQPNCPKCPAAKKLIKELRSNNKELRIEEFNVSTVDGLAEASFYSVMATPGLVLCDDKDKTTCSWLGEVPSLKEILEKAK